MYNFFGKNLKYLRAKHKMTQEAFAALIGKKKSIIGNYEKGKILPNVALMEKIAQHFGLSWKVMLEQDLQADSSQGDAQREEGLQAELHIKTRLIAQLEKENLELKEALKALKKELKTLRAPH
jgi:transcriptional regulator with XRE-family HTH domain